MLGTVKKLLRTDEDDGERTSATTDGASEDTEDYASGDSDDDDIYDMVRAVLLEFDLVAGEHFSKPWQFHIDTSNNDDEVAGSLARSASVGCERQMSSDGGRGKISLALTNKQTSVRLKRLTSYDVNRWSVGESKGCPIESLTSF